MARLLFVQPSMQPPGGGNGVAAWMVQALAEVHDLTLLTWAPLDLDATNRFYGTVIDPSCVRHIRVSPGQRLLAAWSPTPMALLRRAIIAFDVRRLAPAFDLVVTADNEADFGVPNVHYVHYPWRRRPRPTEDIRWYHLKPALDAYYRIAEGLLQFAPERMLASRTLVNSDWTGARFRECYGRTPETVYPPVAGPSRGLPWEERANGFIALGRLMPSKRVEHAVEIVGFVRRHVPDARLHIVGSADDRGYFSRLQAITRNVPWISWHLRATREEVNGLIAANRWGLHTMHDEHFGMAPAEMMAGGCVVWVHASGGQVEIVGGDSRLTFSRPDDAGTRILALMGDQAALAEVRRELACRLRTFGTDVFMARIRQIVLEELEKVRDRAVDQA